ncbi:ankyrin repeat-containing domain protein [Microdochium bolleyi]|uniref:Ankyrin repeat-containing domain protein n=1 Tax=Microdochium bolleyi TaxID=196109 RepID=A0A136IPK8_9PEZI|nr:ankyrin repeat-containing domain protein [Microdochium bolleyi]
MNMNDDDQDKEDYCWTPLQSAAKAGDLDAITTILGEATAAGTLAEVVNAPPAGYYGRTALQAACESGHEAIVSALLAAGARVDAPGGHNSGRTALQLACLTTSTAAVPNLQLHYGNEDELVEHLAVRHRVVDMLLESAAAGEDVINKPASRYSGRTALQAASEAGDAALVKKLLALGADANAPPSLTLGLTALQAAAGRGHRDVVRMLLDAGANANGPACRHRGYTALQGACLHGGSVELVDALLKAGADPNQHGSRFQGGYALHAAVEGGNVDIVRALLKAGARVDVTPSPSLPRQTPLQSAMLLPDGQREVMEQVLRDAGAVPEGGLSFKCGSLLEFRLAT